MPRKPASAKGSEADPLYLRIGPCRYELRTVANLAQQHGCTGRQDYNAQRIDIDATCSGMARLQTIWHEALHGIYDGAGVPGAKQNEQMIDAAATGILNVLVDNPWLVDEIASYAR